MKKSCDLEHQIPGAGLTINVANEDVDDGDEAKTMENQRHEDPATSQ